MQERSADARAASDHGITVEQVQLPAGRPFQANCLCGWQSEIIPTRPAAVAAGMEHVDGTGSVEANPFDPQLEYSIGDVDPLIDPCPTWCAWTPHKIEADDEDRYHAGPDYRIVLRDLTADYYCPPKAAPDQAIHTLGYVWMYLQQRTRERKPMIHACLNDTSTGIDITLDEAELVARALLEMVEAAR